MAPATAQPLAPVRGQPLAIPQQPLPPSLSRASETELVLVTTNMDAAKTVAARAAGYRWRLRQRRTLDNLGWVMSVFVASDSRELDSQLSALKAQVPELLADENHRYRLQGKGVTYGQQQIGWQVSPGCGQGAVLGQLDSAVDAAHPALQGAALEQRGFLPAGVAQASQDHGTASAALLVGNGSNNVTGLLPGATLYAASVFRQGAGGAETDSALLLEALDWLAGVPVPVVAMSLGGPRNQVLEVVLRQLHQRGMRFAAAVGNDGKRSTPQWPAAQPEVVAVTALDARKRLYRKANRGDAVDIAAPGVEIWTAKADGQYGYMTGTSFAVPFVAAALTRNPAEALMANAEDLGEPGKDAEFGAGLLRARCD
ncbi:hypothetical protein Y5S_03003 [Alcanivorax nanhaiticus]|uniref:Peptidase S8/S53 domain-containing protein n=1 Tax=Alcanivorax nanhaiticus TaxID=1177154 RepID=A0A095SGP9_9GAMM|nr:hypothetical protein Y5S_03003 [Alcanivorax nanhaiticus]